MKQEIIEFSIDTEMDLVLANKRAVKLGKLVGLTKSEQTRFGTALSEISRNCIEYAKEGTIGFSIQKNATGFSLVAEINDKGDGIADIALILNGMFYRNKRKGLGILNAKKLVDDFDIQSDRNGTRVTLGFRFKTSANITDGLLHQWGESFKNELPVSPYDEIKKRNLQLVLLADQLKRSEANYSILTDTVPDLIWSTDAKGNILFANKWFHEYSGQQIKDFTIETIMHPEDIPHARKLLKAHLHSGKFYQFECRLSKCTQTNYLWHLFKSVPVNNEYGEVDKWVNVCTDINAQKKIEEAYRDNEFLKSSQKQLKENQLLLEAKIIELNRVNSELTQFAYVSSHDLQEPLRKITSFGTRLQEDYVNVLDERGKMYLERMVSSSNKLKTLIEHLFSFARIERVESKFIKKDLTALAQAAVDSLKEVIKKKNAKIYLEKGPEVKVDPVLILELFVQLIGNSLKYSKVEVAPVINVAFKVLDEPLNNALKSKKTCQIQIADNGLGFHPDYAERIFRMFQKLGSDNELNAGAGLAISKKIVDKHNGLIRAEGKSGDGAVFTVLLPM